MEGVIQKPATKERENYLFCAMAVVLCVRHILQLLGFSQIASVLFAGLYILTAAFSFSCLWRKLYAKQTRGEMVCFLLGLCGFVYLSGMLFLKYSAYLQQSAVFLLTLPILIGADRVTMSEYNAKLYFRLVTVLGILLSILVFVPSGYKKGLLLLYSANANQSGLLYMSVFLGVYMYHCLYKKHWALYLVLAGLLYGCYRTGSRTCILACILLIVLSFFIDRKQNRNKRWLMFAMVLFVALPFLSATLVEWLGADFKIMGESAWTGREQMWPEIIEKIARSPLTFKIDDIIVNRYGEGLGAHNAWLSVAWDYSVPVAALFLLLLYRMGCSFGVNKKNAANGVVVACFISGLLHMSFEAALICGALDYSLYFLLPLFAGAAIVKKRECSEIEKDALNQCDCSDIQNGTVS